MFVQHTCAQPSQAQRLRADVGACQVQVNTVRGDLGLGFDARGYAELQEHLAQVVVHRLGAQEHLACGVTVAGTARDQLGDPQLLRGQRIQRAALIAGIGVVVLAGRTQKAPAHQLEDTPCAGTATPSPHSAEIA
jgi:hypothetical protein